MQGHAVECESNSSSLIKLRCLPAQHKNTGSLNSSSSISSTLPLVLIHGWASSSKIWQPLVDKLNLKRDLWLIDLPACGDNNFVDDFSEEELLAALTASLPDRCVLVGWSLGGMLATQLAAANPNKVRGLITLATNQHFVANSSWPWAMKEDTFKKFYEGFSENADTTFKRFIALQALGDANKKELIKTFEKLSSSPTKKQHASWSRLLTILSTLDNSDSIKKLSCPGLHLFADNDALVSSEAASHIYSHNVNQSVELLADCGHALHLSQPALVSEKINCFIEQVVEQDENGVGNGKGDSKDKNKGKTRIAQAFGKAASHYDAVANLQREVAEKLVSMADYLQERDSDIASILDSGTDSGVSSSTSLDKEELPTKTLLDLGCGTGFVSDFLMQSYPQYNFILADLSEAMCKRAQIKLLNKYKENAQHFTFITADMDALPLVAESVDCVISSMSLQWSANTQALLSQLWSCLKPGGRLLFSTVGEATLKELSLAWKKVDDYVHVNPFMSASALLTLAEQQHFSCEQMQSEIREQGFTSVIELMKNLKTIGAHTVNTGQNHGLTSRARLHALELAYEKFRNKENVLPATWEIHYFVLRKEVKEGLNK